MAIMSLGRCNGRRNEGRKRRPRIDSTSFGSIKIDGKTYESDVMVTWMGKVKEAQTEVRHFIGEADFLKLLFERPDVVVVGTGQQGCMEVGEGVRRFAKDKKIRLVAKPTPEAARKFNQLAASGKHVVAYMHVTC